MLSNDYFTDIMISERPTLYENYYRWNVPDESTQFYRRFRRNLTN
ncbi:8922_t:CDS:1, partial [Funneliformis geosporum]